MKILQINKFFYLRGGAERHFFDVCKLLEDKGHEVIHFSMQDTRNTPSPYSKYFVSNLELGDIKKTPWHAAGRILYSREAAAKLAALIDKTKPDVAHVHLIYYHLSHAVLKVLHEKGVPIVFTLHDWKLVCPHYLLYPQRACREKCCTGSPWNAVRFKCLKNSYGASFLAALEYSFVKRRGWYSYIDALIAPSQFVKDKFESFGWQGGPITIIPHFVEAPAYVYTRAFAKNDPVLFTGRLAEEKGLRFLLRAWAEQKIEHKLLIAGAGPLEQTLKDYVKAHGLRDRVQFLGFLNQQALAAQIASAGLLVMPSEFYETFGYSAMEALARGLPVLASDIGAVPEYLKRSGGGWVHALNDERAFAQKLKAIMADIEGRTKAAQSGAQFVKKLLNKEQFYQKLMKVYEAVTK